MAKAFRLPLSLELSPSLSLSLSSSSFQWWFECFLEPRGQHTERQMPRHMAVVEEPRYLG